MLMASGMRIPASTWSVGGVGIAFDIEVARNLVKDQIDIFLNAWLSVNPKE
jgi:hypothetical protein